MKIFCRSCGIEYEISDHVSKSICPHCHFISMTDDTLITMLMQETFHCNNKEAEIIVDKFIVEYPQILKNNSIDYLYKI